MRVAIRPFVMALSIALMAALGFTVLSQKVFAQEAASPEEGSKQDALTDKQIDAFLAAQKDVEAIVAKSPEGDQPDPKVMEQLEAVAKKYGFANYAEYDDVAANISLVRVASDFQFFAETQRVSAQNASLRSKSRVDSGANFDVIKQQKYLVRALLS